MKNHIREILSILCLSLFFVGCQASPNSQKQTLYEPPISGLSWGMDYEDILSALNLNESNLTKETNEYGDITLKLPDTYTFYGLETTQVQLYVRTAEKDNMVLGLFNIYGLLPEKDTQKLQNSLTDTFGSQGLTSDSTGIPRISWIGGQIPSQIQNKEVVAGLKRYYNEGEINTMETPNPGPLWDDIKDMGSVSVSLISSDLTGEVQNTIQIDGSQAAAIAVLEKTS